MIDNWNILLVFLGPGFGCTSSASCPSLSLNVLILALFYDTDCMGYSLCCALYQYTSIVLGY